MNFGSQWQPRKNVEEAEKPFWISYADLMTALMILFLVIMVASLSAITRKAEAVMIEGQSIKRQTTATDVRAQEIESVCDYLSERSKLANPHIQVDCALNRIHFGEYGRFKTKEYTLPSDGKTALLQAIPAILETAKTPLGKKWLKQIVIEGYTDTDGSYLFNLNLSLKRSEWVMCTLLRNDHPDGNGLTAEQRKEIKKLFLAGGVSFNNGRDSKEASRRVELKLQFYGNQPEDNRTASIEHKFEDDTKERCMLGV